MIRIIRDEITIPLPALEPPEPLLFAYQSAQQIAALIAAGTIVYTGPGIATWQRSGPSARQNQHRRLMVAQVKAFLEGEKLAAAADKFRSQYQRYLQTTPAAQAACFFVREQLRRGAVLEGVPVELRSVL